MSRFRFLAEWAKHFYWYNLRTGELGESGVPSPRDRFRVFRSWT